MKTATEDSGADLSEGVGQTAIIWVRDVTRDPDQPGRALVYAYDVMAAPPALEQSLRNQPVTVERGAWPLRVVLSDGIDIRADSLAKVKHTGPYSNDFTLSRPGTPVQ